jgi:hypothetical protein
MEREARFEELDATVDAVREHIRTTLAGGS